ncbi:MAG: PEP-CTERM sorting domain-containing protein [Arthrospira sp. SH-MAG29]|nr:choice-of-anchor W domain-containing protein [Arthrospira sp. SH-MAG29]MBS0015367.1 PEP-CTERM sorting domain-containing protein [Arthrospira sp. SH-MAG29]
MNKLQSLLTVAVATLTAIATPGIANAFTVRGNFTSMDGSYGADMMFNDLFPDANSGAYTSFVAENRFGDLGRLAEREFKLFDHSNTPLTNQNQSNFAWVNNQAYNFQLSNDGNNWTYSLFDLDNNLLTSVVNTFTAPYSDIFIRTRAGVGNSMVIDNLSLNGIAVDGRSAVENPTDGWGADYLWIGDVSGPFTLTGQTLMGWQGQPTALRSALASQIKVVYIEGETQPVPEPTLLIGLGVVGLAMTRLGRRKA